MERRPCNRPHDADRKRRDDGIVPEDHRIVGKGEHPGPKIHDAVDRRIVAVVKRKYDAKPQRVYDDKANYQHEKPVDVIKRRHLFYFPGFS
jgi:hypothetical protein